MDDHGQYTFDDGYVCVAMIEGGEHRCALDEHTRLLDAIHAKHEWITFTTVAGAIVLARVSQIESIEHWSADTLTELRRLNVFEKQQKSWMDND